MKTRKNKYLYSGLLLFIVLMVFSISAKADDTSYSLTLKCFVWVNNTERAIAGDEFAVIKVADCFVDQEGGYSTLDYKTVERFEKYDCIWNDMTSSELRIKAKEIAADVTRNDYEDTQKTDSNGTAVFSLKDKGFYLVVRSDIIDENITFEPFLISVPQIIDQELDCDVVSFPKFEYDTDTNLMDGSDTDTVTDTDTNTDTAGDTTVEHLPQTGQINLPIVFLLCLGIPMIIIGIIMVVDEKKNEEE